MGSTWQNGLSLYNIIQHYDTIMTLIAIIAINTLLWLFPEGEVAFSGQENAGMGHTPRVAKNPSSMIASFGSPRSSSGTTASYKWFNSHVIDIIAIIVVLI